MLLQFPLAMVSSFDSTVQRLILIHLLVRNGYIFIDSIKRISSFLDSDELQTDARDVVPKENIQDGEEIISIMNGELLWSKDGKDLILQNINLKVKKGEQIAVLGQVGAGKVGVPSIFLQHFGNAYRLIRPPRAVCCLASSEQ